MENHYFRLRSRICKATTAESNIPDCDVQAAGELLESTVIATIARAKAGFCDLLQREKGRSCFRSGLSGRPDAKATGDRTGLRQKGDRPLSVPRPERRGFYIRNTARCC